MEKNPDIPADGKGFSYFLSPPKGLVHILCLESSAFFGMKVATLMNVESLFSKHIYLDLNFVGNFSDSND